MAGIIPGTSNRSLVVMFLVALAAVAVVQRNILGIGSFVSGAGMGGGTSVKAA